MNQFSCTVPITEPRSHFELLERRDLPASSARAAMATILAGDATAAQLIGFVVALRAKGETGAEVAGLVRAMLAHAAPLVVDADAVDTCGTGGDTVKIALASRERLVSENDDKFRETSTRLVRMDFASTLSHQAVTFGTGLYMAGACPMHYDGRLWSELGFHVGPELITTVTAGGGSMPWRRSFVTTPSSTMPGSIGSCACAAMKGGTSQNVSWPRLWP